MAVPGTFEPNLTVIPSSGCVGGREGQVRRALEDERDLRHAARQPLARAQVKRHPGPAPGIDAEPQGGVSLGPRIR
jgi:hypothetical protein